MLFLKRIKQKKLNIVEPDFDQEKKGRHLLVWKNIPYWMVVDKEFYKFLKQCNGSNSVESILSEISGSGKVKKDTLQQIQNLLSTGIFDIRQENNFKTPNTIPIENISINVTNKCNLRCAFCYNIDALSQKTDDELSSDEIISLLKQTKPFLSKNPSLAIVGGEPLEFPDKVIAVAEYAIKNHFITLISSNGTKVTDDFAKRAKEINLEVQVSIDGHTAQINDAVRGKGSFEKTIKGIKTLVKNGTYTTLNLVCHSGNFKYLKNFYEMAVSLGVNEARFIPLKKLGGGLETKYQPVSTMDMIIESLSIFKKNEKFQKLIGRDCFTILANTCRFSSKRISCGTGLQTFLLDADGTIYPCLNTLIQEFKVVNIRDIGFNFKNIWKNSSVLKTHRELTSVQNTESPCSKCLVKYWCLGGCRGETYLNKGKLNSSAINCADLRKSILEMFWILSDNNSWIKSMEKIG